MSYRLAISVVCLLAQGICLHTFLESLAEFLRACLAHFLHDESSMQILVLGLRAMLLYVFLRTCVSPKTNQKSQL